VRLKAGASRRDAEFLAEARWEAREILDRPQLNCEYLDGAKLSEANMATTGFAVEVSVVTMSTDDQRVELPRPPLNGPGATH